jgi:hypothetical protein
MRFFLLGFALLLALGVASGSAATGVRYAYMLLVAERVKAERPARHAVPN